jgi:LmbE family N-acetylglucosaminyl deacetylase
MANSLTLMAVHAHPDDEASSTGGVLATYSAEGIRTVVVTCTNGEFGDAPGGIKPGQDGHDEDTVAQIRLAELRQSVKLLGVTDLELLGYHDSGMPEWDYKTRPNAFCNIPAAEVTGRISGLIEKYRPQVLITYDDKGLYQHPDHVYASQMAQAAVAETGIPAKLYLSTIRGSSWDEQRAQAAATEASITTTVDIRPMLARKRDALMAHVSQIQESWFAKLPPELAEETFGFESFIRTRDTTGAPVPETDLFAGLH